jgi:ssDNA-binding Zn-finger/Zn-ribbon topoisomerase 1
VVTETTETTEGIEELAPDELGTEQAELTATPPTGGPCPDCGTAGVLYAVGKGVRHLRCPACDRLYGEQPA